MSQSQAGIKIHQAIDTACTIDFMVDRQPRLDMGPSVSTFLISMPGFSWD